MGTDDLGRDVLTGVIYGSRLSLIVGFCCSAVSLIVGVLIGCVSGYCGGRVDDILMRITEMVMTMPRVLVALVVIAMMRTTSITYIIFIISILSWTTTARLVRADILSLKGREFVEAARGLGAGSLRILFGEILPNVMPVVVVNSTFEISSAIATEAGLGFLGLSDPRAVSWGHMLSNSQRYLRAAWWMATFPGAALFLTMLALNSVGDGLNDALNPKLRER
jgi:peptide/nickel transport system permease protein